MVAKRAYVPDRGDVVWANLNPTREHEQHDRRPALVLSPRSYSKKTHLMVVVPITSQVKGYPFEVAVQAGQIHGVVLADQVRTLDWHARRVSLIAKAPGQTTRAVQALVVALISG